MTFQEKAHKERKNQDEVAIKSIEMSETETLICDQSNVYLIRMFQVLHFTAVRIDLIRFSLINAYLVGARLVGSVHQFDWNFKTCEQLTRMSLPGETSSTETSDSLSQEEAHS